MIGHIMGRKGDGRRWMGKRVIRREWKGLLWEENEGDVWG